MSVKAQHPKYKEALSKWERCKDAEDGQDAIHDKGVTYLPKLKDQDDESYKAYKTRANFFNATSRTIAGLTGLLLRKAPSIDVNPQVESLFENITSCGESLYDLTSEVVGEVLEVGRIGLLVDVPRAKAAGLTVADATTLNIRPFISTYDARCIINWRTKKINNISTLTLVVLQEDEEIDKNEFEFECEPRFRVLDLENDKVYRQRLFKVNDKGEDIVLEEFRPLMRGATLDYIPFVFINSDDLTPDICEPPLIDLVNINLAHYRVSADYEHGCHFTGLPTPIVSGYTPQSDTEKLYIGSTSAWVFPDSNAKASFLEFSGQGLTALENNMQAKQEQMAVLGARMIAVEKRAVEAAESLAIRQSGENSALVNMGLVISKGMQKILFIFSDWLVNDTNVTFELNKDFVGTPLSAQDLTALIAAWQSGAISQETLFKNLKAGELYDDTDTFEDEQSKIDANPAAGSTLNTTSQFVPPVSQ
jgi:hypothetical protein